SLFKAILGKIFPSDDRADEQKTGASPAESAPGFTETSSPSGAPIGTSGTAAGAVAAGGATATPGAPADTSSAGGMPPSSSSVTSAGAPESGAAVPPGSAGNASMHRLEPVDVDAVLTALQAQHSQQLNWKTSIVDLLKLLG